MTNPLGFGLIAAVLFQFAILLVNYIDAQRPLWHGKEIRLLTLPEAPRSLLRGDYAQLNYAISQLDVEEFPMHDDLRNGEMVYVLLRSATGGVYAFDRVVLEKPNSGVFIRGRIANRRDEEASDYFRVVYGVEAFFVSREEIQELGRVLQDGAVVSIMLSENGDGRVRSVMPTDS